MPVVVGLSVDPGSPEAPGLPDAPGFPVDPGPSVAPGFPEAAGKADPSGAALAGAVGNALDVGVFDGCGPELPDTFTFTEAASPEFR